MEIDNIRGYYKKGFVALNRQGLFSLISDNKITSAEKFLFIKLAWIAFPFNFEMKIDDGSDNISSIKIKQGEIFISKEDLSFIAETPRIKTILSRLKNLNKQQYIEFRLRKSRYLDFYYIKIKDYNFYIIDLKKLRAESAHLPPSRRAESAHLPPSRRAESVQVSLVDPHKIRASEPSKTIYNHINQQQQEEVVVKNIKSLFETKSKQTLPLHVAQHLISKFSYDRIIIHIRRLNLKKADNPIALLIDSLENPNKYDLIPTQEEIKELEELKKKKHKEEQELKEKEILSQYQESEKEFEYFKKIFEKLPPDQQETLRNQAKELLILEGKENNLSEESIKAYMLLEPIIQIKINSLLKNKENIFGKIKRLTTIGLSVVLFYCSVYGKDLPSLEELKANLLKNNLELQIKKQELKVYKTSNSFLNNFKFISSYNFELNQSWHGIVVNIPFTLNIPHQQTIKQKELSIKLLEQEKIKELEDLYFSYQNLKNRLSILKKNIEQKNFLKETKDQSLIDIEESISEAKLQKTNIEYEIVVAEFEIKLKKEEFEKAKRDYIKTEKMNKKGIIKDYSIVDAKNVLEKCEYELLVLEKKIERLINQFNFYKSKIANLESFLQAQQTTTSFQAEQSYLIAVDELSKCQREFDYVYNRILQLCGL